MAEQLAAAPTARVRSQRNLPRLPQAGPAVSVHRSSLCIAGAGCRCGWCSVLALRGSCVVREQFTLH
eukprot:15456393-Alexandrium_andersonii.AAC.1